MAPPGRGNILITFCLALWVSACAQIERQESFHPVRNFPQFAAKLDRLNNIVFPLSVAAAALCKPHLLRTYGFELHDKNEYTRLLQGEYLEAAIRHYGLGDGVFVRYVHPALPAGAAALAPNYIVISLDGQSLKEKTSSEAGEILRRLDRLKEGPLHIVVKDAHGERALDIYSVPACKHPVVLVQSNLVNAFADGAKIVITTGMLDFTTNDSELAVVVAHEMAHNALGHADDIRLRTILDALFTAHARASDQLAAASEFSFSKEFEAEADYVGMFIASRAGYDLSKVGQFWARIGRQRPAGNAPAYATTHPSYPERVLAFETTLREIEDLRQRGGDIWPKKTRKPHTPAVSTSQP
jgi:Zn-dependent protease with chaperone function